MASGSSSIAPRTVISACIDTGRSDSPINCGKLATYLPLAENHHRTKKRQAKVKRHPEGCPYFTKLTTSYTVCAKVKPVTSTGGAATMVNGWLVVVATVPSAFVAVVVNVKVAPTVAVVGMLTVLTNPVASTVIGAFVASELVVVATMPGPRTVPAGVGVAVMTGLNPGAIGSSGIVFSVKVKPVMLRGVNLLSIRSSAWRISSNNLGSFSNICLCDLSECIQDIILSLMITLMQTTNTMTEKMLSRAKEEKCECSSMAPGH